MGRLIDIDEAIKSFEKYGSFMGEPLTERDAHLVKCVLALFDSRPTAYDVEAVVKELEAKSTLYAHEAEGDKDMGYEYLTIRKYGISDGLDIAIEIVKRGGRNE